MGEEAAGCAVCGGAVPARPRGRPSVYCSRACQAKAYRARKGGAPAGAMSTAEARRRAAFHAATAIETALADGWETLDRYGVDRPRVQAALNDLVAELGRRAQEPSPRTAESDEFAAPVTESAAPPREPAPTVSEKAAPQGVTADAGEGTAPPLGRDEIPAPVTEMAPGRVGEVRAARLYGQVYVLLADGRRVGWIEPAPGEDGHGLVRRPDGGTVATVPYREVPSAVRAAAAALGVPGAEDTNMVTGPLTDHRGRTVETAPADLARWRLLRGRVPGREDVIVRGRIVGWLQPHPRGGYVPCTMDGPAGPPASTRENAAVALFAALYAPAPLPELLPEARTRRRPQARPRNERPLCPYSQHQLAAAAIDPPRAESGGYEITVDDYGERVVLGRVYRSGRHWQVATLDGRVLIHRAVTRTEAIDRCLGTPGPLWGDPDETVRHNLDRPTELFGAVETVLAAVRNADGVPGTSLAAALDALATVHLAALHADTHVGELTAAAAEVVRARPPHLPARADAAITRLAAALPKDCR